MLSNSVGTATLIAETLRLCNLAINHFQYSNQFIRTILNHIAEALDKTAMVPRINKEKGIVTGTVLYTMSYLLHTYSKISDQSLNEAR